MKKTNVNHVGMHNCTKMNGITLIALIITIIVMLILVGVTVNVAINGGLFSTAKKATAETQYQADRESLLSAVIGAINDNAEVDFEELDKNLPDGFTKNDDGGYTSKAGNTFCVNKSGNIIKSIPVTVGSKTVMLTPKNVGDYLGKVVTNYKKDYNTNTTETIDGTEYKVSTKYRLYYVDFDNKYKDGEGTIYLKADCTSNKYTLPTTDTTLSTNPTADNIKIKNLNPELYKAGVIPPDANNTNMKAVTWLTNTTNWEGLKQGVNSEVAKSINYVVGAPSLEMMMDSYNTHYGLTDSTSNTSTSSSNSVKLFYKYPYDDKKYGYGVGFSNDSSVKSGYYTSDYPVKSDSKIDSMYYPGDWCIYWLASPSAFFYEGNTYLFRVVTGSDKGIHRGQCGDCTS